METIATIILLGLTIAAIDWFARHSKSTLALDEAPEVFLQHRLKFADEDLEQNRSGTISPKQIKRIWIEFLILLIVYMAVIVLVGVANAAMFSSDLFRSGFDLLLIVALGCIGLSFPFVVGIAIFHLRGYVIELRKRKATAFSSPLVIEEHQGEHMRFKFRTHQYKMIVNDPRLPKPLSLSIGFMSEDVWDQIQKLRHQTAIVYIAPNTLKVLSFELNAIEPALSQKDAG